ncbi:MAG: hypothetical protein P4N60_14375 [Verrucomicrobiae bacterium]|nr:hypothetical protein [Verrucomicrobiae bacterium]
MDLPLEISVLFRMQTRRPAGKIHDPMVRQKRSTDQRIFETFGHEALLCLETFWRNDRWQLLFPHPRRSDLAKN